MELNKAKEIAYIWHENIHDFKFIRAGENHVFQYSNNHQIYYLRCTAASHRIVGQISAELDFVNYLFNQNLAVAPAIINSDGNSIESISEGTKWHIACFKEAPGDKVKYKSTDWNASFFKLWGKYLQQIHSISSHFIPKENQRFHWYEDLNITDGKDVLEKNEKEAFDEFKLCLEWVNHLPKDKSNYGVIHGDLGISNFNFKDNIITAFDFDDSCYHWYMYDVAVALWPTRFLKDEERNNYLNWMLEGYLGKIFDQKRIEQEFEMFMRLRNVWMFINWKLKWDLQNLTEDQEKWFARMRKSFVNPIKWNVSIPNNKN